MRQCSVQASVTYNGLSAVLLLINKCYVSAKQLYYQNCKKLKFFCRHPFLFFERIGRTYFYHLKFTTMTAHKKIGSSMLLSLPLFLLISSCSKSTTPVTPPPTVVKHWDIIMNAKYENPAPAGRSETGTAGLDLYSDNTFKYSIAVTGLASGDALTGSHIHFGDAGSNGPVLLSFNPTFANGAASATLPAIRQTLADSLQNSTVYVNVHSTQVPSGLLRGQIDKTIDFAIDVPMVGTNEVPLVATTATGLALLRLTTDKTLYSKLTVASLESNDTLSVAHIHGAAAGANGSVLQGLCTGEADFGVVKSVVLTDVNVTAVKTGAVYVNAHSKRHPGGIVRGQIR
jgi:CHRD domain